MKKLLMAGGLLCVMIMVSLAAPVALPNDAGTWVLDKEKSKDLPPMMADMGNIKMAVKQDEKQFTVDYGVGGGEIVYMLDGSRTKVRVQMRTVGELLGDVITYYLEMKDDGKIVLHSVRKVRFNPELVGYAITDVWEMTNGGKTLTVQRTIESLSGRQEMTLVFTKKA